MLVWQTQAEESLNTRSCRLRERLLRIETSCVCEEEKHKPNRVPTKVDAWGRREQRAASTGFFQWYLPGRYSWRVVAARARQTVEVTAYWLVPAYSGGHLTRLSGVTHSPGPRDNRTLCDGLEPIHRPVCTLTRLRSRRSHNETNMAIRSLFWAALGRTRSRRSPGSIRLRRFWRVCFPQTADREIGTFKGRYPQSKVCC